MNENDWYQNEAMDRLRIQWLLRMVWNANGDLVVETMNIADCHLQPVE